MIDLFKKVASSLMLLSFVLLLVAVVELTADTEGDEFFPSLSNRHLQQTSTSTSTRVNIFQKLGESLGLTIVGCILICIAPILIWKNEGRHVHQLKRIDFCKNKAVVVPDASSPSTSNTGCLVHFIGEVTVDDKALNFPGKGSTLNLVEPLPKALLVKRTCYIYQKFERAEQSTQNDRLGGGETRTATYTMVEDWTAVGPQEERLQHLPEQVNNRGIWDALAKASDGGSGDPTAEGSQANELSKLPNGGVLSMMMSIDPTKPPHALNVSAAARVGGFGLSRDIIMEEPMAFAPAWAPIPSHLLPDTVIGCDGLRKTDDNILRTFDKSTGPQNGDIKVVYEYVPDGFDCSFVVEQVLANDPDPETGSGTKFGVAKSDVVDNKCVALCHHDYGVIWMVRRGRHDLHEMVEMAKQEENMLVKVLRIVCWVALFAGWCMLFAPFTTALQVLPLLSSLGSFAVAIVAFIVSCACCMTFTSAAYIAYRPIIAFGILAIVGGIWGIIAWRLNIAATEGG